MALASDTQLSPEEFGLLRQYIEAESGISLGDDKVYLMESRFKKLLTELGCATYGDLYRKAKEDSKGLVRQKIIDAITTNETLWFRDKGPFVILEEVLLPAMVKRIEQGRPKVRIWSAACSTGQEPYSLAILIHNCLERLGNNLIGPANFEIIATDISTEALGVARMGAYDQFNMERGMDATNFGRYFRQNQRYWIVDPKLKRIIDFREFNLQGNFSQLGNFDLVLCRNVAIYFAHETKVELFEKIRRTLNPGGTLLLGSTESMTFHAHSFQSREHKGYVYYHSAL